jgi:GntR family transcriptional regulator/MocR family aminotransferase
MQQAMLLSAMALINPGDAAWIEDPGFHQAHRALAFAGARVIPRPIDHEGIVIDGATKKQSPRIIFVTPSHQFPLGVTMSLARRRGLIDFARSRDAFILEDDYNSEFRFNGPPLPCLQGLDHAGRVIYAGTMSKILYPSLRLGYLLVPEQLVDSMLKIRSVMDQHSPAIDQATLARFINEGFFLSHVKRMRKLYSDRRDFFLEQFNRLLGDRFVLHDTEAGLHFVAWLRRGADFERIKQAGIEIGVKPVPLSRFCIKAKLAPAFVFGFAAWSRAQIKEGLTKLALALK